MTAKLHYIHDPLCGWCYGAEPLVNAAARVGDLDLVLHAGELWQEPTRLPEQMRQYIQEADMRIAQMSGQPYSDAYLRGLLHDPDLVLESRPTIAAVLAAESLDPTQALPMLQAIQHSHYEKARHVVNHEVLCDIAEECGLDRDDFEAAMTSVALDAHIAESRRLMARVGARGFPTFVLQVDEEWIGVPHQQFAADPAGFADWLTERVRAHA